VAYSRAALSVLAIVSVALEAGLAAAPDRGPAKPSDLGKSTLAECAGLDEAVGEADAMIAIDTSRSTVDATGVDVDLDGELGRSPFAGQRVVDLDAGSSDPGDSFLAAQVSASLSLIRDLEQPGLRLGIVTFSGVIENPHDRRRRFGFERNAGPRPKRNPVFAATSNARVDALPITRGAAARRPAAGPRAGPQARGREPGPEDPFR
jgi:hypothetical protein